MQFKNLFNSHLGQKMRQNFKQGMFNGVQNALLMFGILTPMSAISDPVGVDIPVNAKPSSEKSQKLSAATTLTTEVAPIPRSEKQTLPTRNDLNDNTELSQEVAQLQPEPVIPESEMQTQITPAQLDAATSIQLSVSPTEQQNIPAQNDAPVAHSPTTHQLKQSEVRVPSGAAIQPQLMPLAQSSENPWASYATVGFLILGMAATGLLAVKLRQGRSFGSNKSERQMQIISSLALSPKRQILLVKIRDKEVALASTETGITLLTEMDTPFRAAPHLVDESGGEDPRRRKVQQKILKEEPSKMIAASSESAIDDSAMARSEMLMGALKNLREKSMRGKTAVTNERIESTVQQPIPETRRAEEPRETHGFSKSQAKAEPTLRQTRAAFPKYLANAFEKEANRAPGQSQTDEAGNVTNMIRERLKELRPLA